jgi:hypothetical protein
MEAGLIRDFSGLPGSRAGGSAALAKAGRL